MLSKGSINNELFPVIKKKHYILNDEKYKSISFCGLLGETIRLTADELEKKEIMYDLYNYLISLNINTKTYSTENNYVNYFIEIEINNDQLNKYFKEYSDPIMNLWDSNLDKPYKYKILHLSPEYKEYLRSDNEEDEEEDCKEEEEN